MSTLRALVRFAGWYSIVGGLPLTLPFLRPMTNAGLQALFGHSPTTAAVLPDPTQALLANTAGLLMMFMGMLLLYAARDLPNRAGIVTLVASARLLFSALVLYHFLQSDLARFWVADAVIDTTCSLALLGLLQRAGLLAWRPPTSAPRTA